MAKDRPVPSDEGDAGIEDDVIDELRRCNPVDTAALPSSRSTEAARTLEQILTSDDESESDQSESDQSESDQSESDRSESDRSESDQSSSSPAHDQGGRAEPPPRPTSRK